MISSSIQMAERQPVSQLILYPDGMHRILTMQQHQWDWVREAEIDGYSFNEVLEAALALAAKFPTPKGFQNDVTDSTVFMFMTIKQMMIEGKRPVSNC